MSEISISAKELKDIIATAVGEAVKAAKAPNEIEQRKLDAEKLILQQRQEQRKAQSEQVLETIRQKQALQRICSHQHRDGNTHCVYVLDGNYIICQKNQCIIRPGTAPANYKGGDIYDNLLFNQLFQSLPSNEMFQ